MKKICSVILVLCMVFSAASVFADGITVTVNGKILTFDSEPIIKNDRLLVPMRAIFEALGADVSWNDSSKTASAVLGKTGLEITVGANELYKNGSKIALDAPAVIAKDRTLVPIRAVSEGLGADVDWVSATKTVVITMKEKIYGFGEIDSSDLEKFKADNSARTAFESVDLPGEVAKYSGDFADDIKNKPENVKKYINDVWNHCQAEALLKIMDESSSEYQIGENIAEQLSEIIAEASKNAEAQLEISIKDDFLIISFKDDSNDFAKYIGIKAADGSARLFTAYPENDKTVIYEIKSGIKEKFTEVSGDFSEEDFRLLK